MLAGGDGGFVEKVSSLRFLDVHSQESELFVFKMECIRLSTSTCLIVWDEQEPLGAQEVHCLIWAFRGLQTLEVAAVAKAHRGPITESKGQKTNLEGKKLIAGRKAPQDPRLQAWRDRSLSK